MKLHLWLLSFLLLAPCTLVAQQDVALFDDTIVQDVRLTIDPVVWQTLRDHYDQDDYYSANFASGSASLQNIGIKSRGSGSRSPYKPNLTVKFNKYQKQKFLTHNSILLKANNQDGSMMREYLTMSLMRRLGLPAPREAPARLYVNGEFFGLYTIVEDIDDDFLKRVFGESTGYMYDYNPVLGYNFNYFGDDPGLYGLMYEPKTHEDAPEFAKLFEMLKAVNEASSSEFPTVGPTYVDLVGFMKLLAIEGYVADSDGFLSDVWGMNNFYLYRPAASSQFRFIPWDTDFTMYWSGRPVLQNLDHNVLASKALAVPELRRVYVETMLQVATIAGGEDGWLHGEMDRLYALIGPDARLDPHKQCWRSSVMVACNADDFEREVAAIKQFAVERFTTSVPQLDVLFGSPEPKMSTGGVVNAATNQAGLVPGSLAALYGSSMARTGEWAEAWPLPLTLADVSVTVSGVHAPLLFVSPLQVNFQIPWNLPEGAVNIGVTVDGISADPLAAQLVHAAPGIFAAAHGSDFALINAAKPAAGGEILSLFATGLGPVSTTPRDGEPASLETLSFTVEPVTATLNGNNLEVLFAGLAPGNAGVYQVNVRMPATVVSGDGSLVLKVAGKSSPAFRVPLK
jgi:uncharacterized protein (TIGR03437 family)